MDCFSEISDAQRLYCDWGGENVAPAHSTRVHPFFETLTVNQTRMNAHARTERERTTLLYLWLISDSGYTNTINQAD